MGATRRVARHLRHARRPSRNVSRTENKCQAGTSCSAHSCSSCTPFRFSPATDGKIWTMCVRGKSSVLTQPVAALPPRPSQSLCSSQSLHMASESGPRGDSPRLFCDNIPCAHLSLITQHGHNRSSALAQAPHTLRGGADRLSSGKPMQVMIVNARCLHQ